ncbi:DinB family protein [Shouchella sp. 1P09AA]|uniref:DinB family protein n=1 Tax=unclassified Shouchella TaxID=2893065 RepID=UPI0039A3E13A
MEAVQSIKETALHELEVGIRSIEGLLKKVKEEDLSYRPSENMRTIKELIAHIISIPEVDLAIMQEHSEEYIRALEQKYETLAATEDKMTHMYSGFEQYKAYVISLSDQEFLTKKTAPFYLETGSTQIQWLMEVVTHIFHHRAQLFTYMKQSGYDVNMFDLYV